MITGICILFCLQIGAPPASAGATFCQVAQPIYWSPGDTRQTKAQADRHNAVGKKLCRWAKPKTK